MLLLGNSLGTSFPQVDEDVQRHSELLEVIKGAPSEINEIVARRRKDFTKEFFEHLYTVAASHDDNTTEQDGETKCCLIFTDRFFLSSFYCFSRLSHQVLESLWFADEVNFCCNQQ